MYIVINGGGQVGSFLANMLADIGHKVALIESRAKAVDRLSDELNQSILFIHGDGCEYEYQRDAGMEQADIFVSATGDDDTNLVAGEIAQVAFNVRRVIARVNSPKNEKIFRVMGFETISATQLIARIIEEETLAGDLRTLITMQEGDMAIVEIHIPQDVKYPEGGRRVADITLPKGSVLVAQSQGKEVNAINGDTMLMPGDMVIAFTETRLEEKLTRALLKM